MLRSRLVSIVASSLLMSGVGDGAFIYASENLPTTTASSKDSTTTTSLPLSQSSLASGPSSQATESHLTSSSSSAEHTSTSSKKSPSSSQHETRKKAQAIAEILKNIKHKPHIKISEAKGELKKINWSAFSDPSQRSSWDHLESKLEEYKEETSEEAAQKIVEEAVSILNTLGDPQESQQLKKVKQGETLRPSTERQQREEDPASRVEQESHHSSVSSFFNLRIY